jgi:hypothetical protein
MAGALGVAWSADRIVLAALIALCMRDRARYSS